MLAISPTNALIDVQENKQKMIQEGIPRHAAALRAAAQSPEHPKRNSKGTTQLPQMLPCIQAYEPLSLLCHIHPSMRHRLNILM